VKTGENFRAMVCLLLIFGLMPPPINAQSTGKVNADPGKNELLNDSVKPLNRPEVLTSGFFDIINNGQLNAAARLIRIYVGENGKFQVPLSIYSGVSSNNFQQSPSTKSNDQLFNNFINPLTGLTNVSTEGIAYFNPAYNGITRYGFIYQVGERILTGYKAGATNNPSTGKAINFLNSYCTLGFYFQTGAWERNNATNMGIFWMATRYIGTYTNARQLRVIIPTITTNGFYHGLSIGWGIEINRVINIKVLYYKYSKAPEIEYGLPIYQFSFNYYVK
jgi:hypothetical protein